MAEYERQRRPRRRHAESREATQDAADQKLKGEIVRTLLRELVPVYKKRDPDGFIAWAKQMINLVLLADVDPMTLAVQNGVQNDAEFQRRMRDLYLEQREWEQARQQPAPPPKEDEFGKVARAYLVQRLAKSDPEREWGALLSAFAPDGAFGLLLGSLASAGNGSTVHEETVSDVLPPSIISPHLE